MDFYKNNCKIVLEYKNYQTCQPLKSISFKKGAKKSQLHEIVRKFANAFTK